MCGVAGQGGGKVVSVDVDAGLVDRARTRHERAGHTNIEVHVADGFDGWVASAPYDRIVGWATPHVLPMAWADQAKPNAVVVTPMKIADVAGANAILRCRIDHSGTVRDGRLVAGSFIEMAPDVITEFGLPVRYVDAVRQHPDGTTSWISAHRLHEQPGHVADRLLTELLAAEPAPEFLDRQTEDWRAFTAFLLASTDQPASLGGPHGWGLGTATPGGVAVILSNGALLSNSTGAREHLAGVLGAWRAADRPGPPDLSPLFSSDEEGWTVRPQIVL